MADRTLYWGMLTPREVRRVSLWAGVGLGLYLMVPPMLMQHARLAAGMIGSAGGIVAMWSLGWIALGAPGWRPGQPGEYDEREMAERHRAMAISYVVVAFCIMTIVNSDNIQKLARAVGLDLPSFRQIPFGAGSVIIFGLMALPGTILAWRGKRIEDVDDVDVRGKWVGKGRNGIVERATWLTHCNASRFVAVVAMYGIAPVAADLSRHPGSSPG